MGYFVISLILPRTLPWRQNVVVSYLGTGNPRLALPTHLTERPNTNGVSGSGAVKTFFTIGRPDS